MPLITPLQQSILDALKSLCADYEPQDSGGFSADDLSGHIPGYFWKSDEIQATCHELAELNLLQWLEAPDAAPESSHWKLPA